MIIFAGALSGAIFCTLLAVLSKHLNLGLGQNIALGAVVSGGVVALVGEIAPSHLASIVLGIAMALIVMALVGAALNARAR